MSLGSLPLVLVFLTKLNLHPGLPFILESLRETQPGEEGRKAGCGLGLKCLS